MALVESASITRNPRGIKGFSRFSGCLCPGACATFHSLDGDAGAGKLISAGTARGEFAGATGFSLVARRNNSLTSGGRVIVFAFIFTVSVGIAVAFAAIGAWPVLPFAGLEMLVLYLAFRHVERHAGDFERIAIEGDSVRVESWEAGQHRCHEFNRCWARLVVEPGGDRVALRSHGRELAIGRLVDAERRLAMARAIERELRVRQAR